MMRMISTALSAFALAAVAVAAPANAATVFTDDDGSWSARYLGSSSTIDLNATNLSTAGSVVNLVNNGTPAGLNGAVRLRQQAAGTALTGIYVFSTVIPLSNVGNIQSLALRWLADNQLFAAVINGSVVFQVPTQNKSPDGTIQARTESLVGSPLVNGSNTLHLLVWNRQASNNNVSLAAEVVTTAVPEPGTWLLMIFGLGAVGFAMRRRQTATVRYQFA